MEQRRGLDRAGAMVWQQGNERTRRDRRLVLASAALAGVCGFAAVAALGQATLAILIAVTGGAALGGALAWLFALSERRSIPLDHPEGAGATTGLAASPLPAFPDPAILLDRRAVVVDANAAAFAILPGLRLRQPLSFGLREPAVLDAVAAIVTDGRAATAEFGGRVPNASVYEVRLRSLGGAGGSPAAPAVALFFRDLSAERRTETMRVDFIANVSHELRTPLASLVGFIETLQGPARGDKAAREKFLAIMATQAARMTRLIDDLLQLSRVELKEHLAPADPVDLAGTVAHMVEVMAPLARERGVTLALAIPPEPLVVSGDRDELLRLVENLVENAIKYGGAGGRVEVAVAGSGRGVDLTVRDHGPGIAPEHLPRLTERFYRVDVASSRQQGGTGLGLAIVKHIVGRHRGRLAIDSPPGEGATVRVTLPVFIAAAVT